MIKYICDRCKKEYTTNDFNVTPVMDIEFICKGQNIPSGGGIEDHCYPQLQLCDKCFNDFKINLKKFVEDYKC